MVTGSEEEREKGKRKLNEQVESSEQGQKEKQEKKRSRTKLTIRRPRTAPTRSKCTNTSKNARLNWEQAAKQSPALKSNVLEMSMMRDKSTIKIQMTCSLSTTTTKKKHANTKK